MGVTEMMRRAALMVRKLRVCEFVVAVVVSSTLMIVTLFYFMPGRTWLWPVPRK